ncbi:MAG: hypothetical protein NTU63_03655 [Candidatus Pacearchaeota archaeon]|nr:hypothetical protein [Candidatus Pacearchaeota archaeon]
MLRIFFRDKKDCLKFFDEIRISMNTRNWRDLGKILGTNKSMIDNYRQKKISIPENRFIILLDNLKEDRRNYFLKLIDKKENNWGQIIGGKKAYSINKESFEKGRKIAAKNKKVKYNFNINLPLSEELCEFIGAIIGDGFTNKYGHLYQTQITGDNLLDSDYYNKRLKPICEMLFNISPKITQKGGWIRLNIYSKNLFEMLTCRFKIPAGIKGYTVTIPNEIIRSKEELINYTLKGMFDTDGGVGIDKRKSYKRPYIRINYTSASKGLINQVSKILLSYNINHSVHINGNCLVIQINGMDNVKRFISKIGFSNKRHLDKINKFLYN